MPVPGGEAPAVRWLLFAEFWETRALTNSLFLTKFLLFFP
jgi:hypothetical protein